MKILYVVRVRTTVLCMLNHCMQINVEVILLRLCICIIIFE